MSWMSYVMDGVLIALLLAALMFGARLNKQLKTLRSGQEAFAQAVADLDRAAISAHASLKELRKDADESQDLLHGRIMAGRDVLQKLESQLSKAERQMKDIDTAIAARAAMLAKPQGQRQAQREVPSETPLHFRASGGRLVPEPVVKEEDDYNPAWSTPKKTAAVRAVAEDRAPPASSPQANSPRDRAPFDRDIVRPAASQLPPRHRFDERRESEDAEMLEKVQMSELVVANLNEMIRSLGMPKRRATVEQDLFGEDE